MLSVLLLHTSRIAGSKHAILLAPQYQSASSLTWSSVNDIASRCSDTLTRCPGRTGGAGGGAGRGTWLLVDAEDGPAVPAGCMEQRCMLHVMLSSTSCKVGLLGGTLGGGGGGRGEAGAACSG